MTAESNILFLMKCHMHGCSEEKKPNLEEEEKFAVCEYCEERVSWGGTSVKNSF